MDREYLIDQYKEFYQNGGYRIARLIIDKMERKYSETEEEYSFLALIKWKYAGSKTYEEYESSLKSASEEYFKPLCEFIALLRTVMDSLPRNWGNILDKRYYHEIKTHSNSEQFRKRTVENALLGLCNAIADNKYDSEELKTIGLKIVEEFNSAVRKVKEDPEYARQRIETSITAVRFYKMQKAREYIETVKEIARNYEVNEKNLKISTQIRYQMLPDKVKVYLADTPCNDNYIYKFAINGQVVKTSETPVFYMKKEYLEGGYEFKIIPELRNISGYVLKTQIKKSGPESHIYIDAATPALYRYQLLENGKVVLNSDKPSFHYKTLSGNDYKIRTIEKEDDVTHKMWINKEYKDMLENIPPLIDIGEKNETDIAPRFLNIMRSLNVIKAADPEKFEKICNFKCTKYEEKENALFWELAILLYF